MTSKTITGYFASSFVTDYLVTAESLAGAAHALAEVGLAPEDPGTWRCPMRATDPITTRHPRDDGWRCGHEAGHTGSHTLYSAEGESVLFAGRWVHPDEVGLTTTSPEEQP